MPSDPALADSVTFIADDGTVLNGADAIAAGDAD